MSFLIASVAPLMKYAGGFPVAVPDPDPDPDPELFAASDKALSCWGLTTIWVTVPVGIRLSPYIDFPIPTE